MEPLEPDRTRGAVVFVLMLAGGVIGMLGSFLTWVQAERGAGGAVGRLPRPGQPATGRPGARSLSVSGLDTTTGRIVLALLIALLVVSVVAWFATHLWFRLGAVTAGLVLGVIVLVLTVLAAASPDALVGLRATRLAGAAGITVGAAVGVYLALAGSALAVVAAGAWLFTNRRSWTGTAAPTSPPPPAPSHDELPTMRLPPPTEPEIAPE
jgi:hypothetical protein